MRFKDQLRDEIFDCLLSPDKREHTTDGICCYKKVKDLYLLLVYGKDEEDNIIVVTVIKTSKLKKYGIVKG